MKWSGDGHESSCGRAMVIDQSAQWLFKSRGGPAMAINQSPRPGSRPSHVSHAWTHLSVLWWRGGPAMVIPPPSGRSIFHLIFSPYCGDCGGSRNNLTISLVYFWNPVIIIFCGTHPTRPKCVKYMMKYIILHYLLIFYNVHDVSDTARVINQITCLKVYFQMIPRGSDPCRITPSCDPRRITSKVIWRGSQINLDMGQSTCHF